MISLNWPEGVQNLWSLLQPQRWFWDKQKHPEVHHDSVRVTNVPLRTWTFFSLSQLVLEVWFLCLFKQLSCLLTRKLFFFISQTSAKQMAKQRWGLTAFKHYNTTLGHTFRLLTNFKFLFHSYVVLSYLMLLLLSCFFYYFNLSSVLFLFYFIILRIHILLTVHSTYLSSVRVFILCLSF